MKKFNVMAEVTIATTLVIHAANEDDAQVAAKQYLETQIEDLAPELYDPQDDEVTIEIGDAEVAE